MKNYDSRKKATSDGFVFLI